MPLQYIYILVLSMTCFKAQVLVRHSNFLKDTIRNVQNEIGHLCITSYDGHITELDCARKCSNRDSCEGFSQDEKQNCYTHSRCFKPVTSASVYRSNDSVNLGLTFYARRVRENCCLNGGVWNPQTESCQCSEGRVGSCCERYPASCKELREYGYSFDIKTNFYLQPSGFSTPFFTRCTLMKDKTLTDIAQFRTDGLLNFNRSWDEYVNGFKDPNPGTSNGFWIGLKQLVYLTQVEKLQQMLMKFSLAAAKSEQKVTYNGVLIGNETEQFEFHYETVKIKAGENLPPSFRPPNCLESKSGLKFSTPDVDNDNDDNAHCAKLAGSGWWFGSCSPNPRCNPFGVPYITGEEEVTPERIFFEGVNMTDFAKEFEDIRIFMIDPV